MEDFKNKIAVITAFADVKTALDLKIKEVLYFNQDLKEILISTFPKANYIPNCRYSKIKILNKIRFIDRFLINLFLQKEKAYIFFSDHDCECLAILTSSKRNKKFYFNNYPSIRVENYNPIKIGVRKRFLDIMSLISFKYTVDENNNLVKFIDISNIDEIGKREIVPRGKIPSKKNFERIIFVDDDCITDFSKYRDAINVYKKCYKNAKFCIKPRFSNINFFNKYYQEFIILDNNIPLELIVKRNDLLIGSYSTVFEYYPEQSESFIYVLNKLKYETHCTNDILLINKVKYLNLFDVSYLDEYIDYPAL